ncbi:uncharacterized protein LOC135156352 [Lytechinus pictus]|uniref:uncharacterized protein LOC135156352 n=1 Tax=Lytechinus pictus TaxID=7653 RepID=UPI0030B9BA5D
MKNNLGARMEASHVKLNGIRLDILLMQAKNGGKHVKMYVLKQVFEAFQKEKKSFPRTTFHKRLSRLHITLKPCKLKEIHRLKWLKAVPNRTSKCCLISHADLLKLCRSCGVETEALESKSKVKTNIKLKRKKRKKNAKKRERDIDRKCKNSNEYDLEYSMCSERIINCHKSSGTDYPNASKSDISFTHGNSVDSDFRTQHVRSGNAMHGEATCKQMVNGRCIEYDSSSSTKKSVEFSFSEPRFGFRKCERRTVTFDIHSQAFSTADSSLFDAKRPKNMRGEAEFDCRETGANMDDNNTVDTCLPIASNANVNCEDIIHSETKTAASKEKEYFGFTGQEKEDNSWKSFGNVPDQDAAAILENTEENSEGEIRFVNGFQFAVAAQQIRVGCNDLESGSDQESELSNLEINSNLSDLSELSVSSESLNSESSRNMGAGEIGRGRWRARVGSNSDGESECSPNLRDSPADFYHGANPGHSISISRGASCGLPSLHSSLCNPSTLWSHHSAMYAKKISDSMRAKNDKSLIMQGRHNNCIRNIQQKARENHENERTTEHECGRNCTEVTAAESGEHQDTVTGASALVLKKSQKSWHVSPQKEGEETLNGEIKLGEKRKSGIRTEECTESKSLPHKKNHKKKRKKKNTRCNFDGEGVEKCDVNGNFVKRAKGSGTRLVSETKPEICHKKKRHNAQREPKKVAELKRKLEAISNELERLQKSKAKKSIGKGVVNCKQEKTRRLKPQETKRKPRGKRKNSGPDPKMATFNMSEFLLLPPSLVVGDGDLKPACSMAVPRGVNPPKCHPVWRWKIGGTPLPRPKK